MPKIENIKVLALADKIEEILKIMPPLKNFESRDPSLKMHAIPDYSFDALKENKLTMEMLLSEIDILKKESLCSYDMLALEQIEYFVKYLMFPVSPLLEDCYWILFDITPYRSPLFFIWSLLDKNDSTTRCGVETHLRLAKDFVRFTKCLRDKVFKQFEMDILIFEFAIDSCIDFLYTYVNIEKNNHPLTLNKDKSIATIAQCEAADFYINQSYKYLFEIIKLLDSKDYREKSPKNPGYMQYPNGKKFYDYMREFHVGYPIESNELNRLGYRCLKENNDIQESIRKKLGFNGNHKEFMEYLKSNNKVYPKNPEALGKLMNDFNDKVMEILPNYFESMPVAKCCAKRLDPMYEKSMTFGYFDAEVNDEGQLEGVYRYSGYGVDGSKNQIVVASLIAHELQPGHHFQESLVRENEELHDLFKRFGNTGYGDGWAEYSAYLMYEAGLYDDLDYYGMLEGDKFLCVRLITDTGMNELGYSIDKARQLMREETYANESMVLSESIRYSACIPGQCLPYKYGKIKMFELRDKYKSIMKDKFDIKKFHSLILSVGNVPLPLLERYIEREALKDA